MKISIPKNFETSRALATEPGKALQDFIAFMSDFSGQIISAMRNGLTFGDNMRCIREEIEVSTGIGQEINSGSRIPTDVIVSKVEYAYPLTKWAWKINDSNRLQIYAEFANSPTRAVKLTLLIFY